MEARLRYQKQLQSGGVSAQLGGKKKVVSSKKKLEKPSTNSISKTGSKTSIKNIEETPQEKKEEITPHHEPRINFIQKNIEDASNQKSRAKVQPKEPKHYENKHAPGEIPSYVEEHKASLSSRKDPPTQYKVPPGMRLLSQEEKDEAIQGLTQEKNELESSLAHYPLTIESQQIKRDIRMKEDKIKEIEKSIQQLQAKFVLVPEDT